MQLGMRSDPRRELTGEINWAAAHGFDYIDVTIGAPFGALETTNWAAVAANVRDSNLNVIAYAGPEFVINNPSPAIRQAALNELRRCIDAAAILGARVLTTRFLAWPSHLEEAAGYEYTRQLYEILLTHGRERGVDIALENSSRNAHQLKWFREIFHRLPDLKLLYNLGNGNVDTRQSMTRDYLFALADRLTQLYISDNDGLRPDRLPPGAPAAGGLNWEREFRILRSFSYDGPITLDIGGDRRWLLATRDMVRTLWEHTA